MKKNKRVFEIIKNFFNSIFNKSKIKLIEETTMISNYDWESEFNNYELIDIPEKEFNNSQEDKKDFAIIYENVKNGVIKLEELMIYDLINIQLMMKNELACIDEKIKISEDEINSINNQINTLKGENKRYYEILKNNN